MRGTRKAMCGADVEASRCLVNASKMVQTKGPEARFARKEKSETKT